MLIFQKLNSSFANLMGTILLLLLTLTILGDYLYKKWKYWEVELAISPSPRFTALFKLRRRSLRIF